MERGGRGIRRTRGGRPFVRGFYRGRTPNRKGTRRPMGSRSRLSSSRDKYESSYNDNDRSDSRERSWDSKSGTDKDISKEKLDEDNSPISRSKWDKDEDLSEKNDERYSDKKGYYDTKYYRRASGHPHRGYRRPYQNNYWDRSDRGRHHSPQSQYRVRPYNSPSRHRRYSRSPDRRRSPSRYRSKSRSRSHSHSPSRSRRYTSPKLRSPKRRSPSRRPRSPNAQDQSIQKTQSVKSNSDEENNSDDFVEKLKASKGSKTPGRVDYTEKSDDEYWIETNKSESKDIKDTKKSNRPEYSSKGSKTPGRSEISSSDKDEHWTKSQTSKTSTKNLYSNSWDDSPIREKSIPKALKTPGRKDYSTKDDDYWINSPPTETKKDRSSNDVYSNKTINKDSTTMYVQELSSSDSEPEKKVTKRTRSMSLTNSDKSDTPPLSTEQSNKLGNRYSQAPLLSSRAPNSILKEPPPPTLPATPNQLPLYNSQWPGIQNSATPYSSNTNYVQPQSSQFTAYQQRQPVPVQNAQWYQPGYQQYGTPFQQFQQYDQKSVAYNPVHTNLEPVEGYQATNQGLYNIDLKNVVDITKPPPNITPVTPVPDTQTKSSQDNIFEMQRETYATKLFSLKKELETLQIQYDTFKLDNTDGRNNNELKKNRKAQDDVNGKIKGVNNILEVLNTMIPKDSLKEIKKVEPKKLTTESEYEKTPIETLQDEVSNIRKNRHRSTSSSSLELKKKRNKTVKSKKSSKVHSSSDEETDSKKSYKSKELIDTSKKTKRIEKLPQFNHVYCDSCIHWCQPCNIFPKTAKEYLTHLHSESHTKTLEELNVVELPWHDTQTEPTRPEKNPELPIKRVPIKGLEFFIGTQAWYCKLCDTWIGDLHCASAHFKSKQHNDLYAELIAKQPNWEIDWLTKRTRAFEKSISQTNTIKQDAIKENKSKESIVEPKVEKSFFEKEPRKEREKEKLRERDRDRDRERDRDKYKKELSRKHADLKSQLSPDKEINDANNVSLSDWMKPVDLPVEKSMITLKESVQKSKDRLHKSKTDEIDEPRRTGLSNVHLIKKQRLEEPKPPVVYEKKDESFNLSHRTSRIKLPFIGKMPFAKPISKKINSSTKDIPNFTVESTTNESKEHLMESVAAQKMLIEKMITAVNEKKIEKHILPVDMDIDDENENNDGIVCSETDSIEKQLNHSQSGNQIHQMYTQPHSTNTLPQDLSTALNMIFPCNEASSVVPSINTSINSQVQNPLSHQHYNTPYGITNNLNISPERKKKKNAPSQRKRRHMKKIMGKEGELTKDEYDDDDDDKLEDPIIQGPKEEINKKSNGNESDGDELAMLGIDAEDMAAQYY